MTSPNILGPLSALHEILIKLVETLPEADANRQFHPQLGSVAWYLGRSVYQELYWLREVVARDKDLTARVAHLFVPDAMPLTQQCAQLPPRDHLLNWAAEIQDEHLTRLANPGLLPAHPLLQDDRLQWFLLQEQSRNYECMLMVLVQRTRQLQRGDYRVRSVLHARLPEFRATEIPQGHYRIGARGDPAACDNEQPPQAVELSGFRIGRQPVSNAEFLAFIEWGGYEEKDYWTQEGWAWKGQHGVTHPDHWLQDASGSWYGIGINGPTDLNADEPVMGINQHESKAYANWAARLGGDFAGAVLPHEYQWEVAARNGVLEQRGRAWEWCSNPFHPYPEFSPFPSREASQIYFDGRHWSLRGGSLHTQRILRRTSYRNQARPDRRFLFAGTRLVFPASD